MPGLGGLGTVAQLREWTAPGNRARADEVLRALVGQAAAAGAGDEDASLVLLHLLWAGVVQLMQRIAHLVSDAEAVGHWRACRPDPSLPDRLHVSLAIGDQLTWLLAAAGVAGCVWVVTRTLALAAVVYLVVAFDPANFDVAHAVVFRDGWYQGVSLLFVSLCFLAVWAATNGARLIVVAALAVLAGLVGAAFWLCREEGAWVLPAVAVIVLGLPAVHLWRRFRSRREATITRAELLRRFRPVALAVALLGASQYAPILAVMQINKSHYGGALSSDMTTGQFATAFADWTRVIAGPTRRDVPITREQRDAVYRISPAALEMKQTMESSTNPWIVLSCHHAPLLSCDLSGAFTAWSLRRSASAVGHFTSEAAFQSYFRQVARDIERACDDGALHCRTHLPAVMQPLLASPASSQHW